MSPAAFKRRSPLRRYRPVRRCFRPWWPKSTVRPIPLAACWLPKSARSSSRLTVSLMWTLIREDDSRKQTLVIDHKKRRCTESAPRRSCRRFDWPSPECRLILLIVATSAKISASSWNCRDRDAPVSTICSTSGPGRSDTDGRRNTSLVPLSELVRVKEAIADKTVYRKNLMPVTYVIGDVAGEIESPVYAIST